MRERCPWHWADTGITDHLRFRNVGLPGADLELVSFRTLEISRDDVNAAMPERTGDGNAELTQPRAIGLEILGRNREGIMRCGVRIVLANDHLPVLRLGALHQHIPDADEDVLGASHIL